jgi:hypothetical protein
MAYRRELGFTSTAASCLGKAAASRAHSKVAARPSNDPGIGGREAQTEWENVWL